MKIPFKILILVIFVLISSCDYQPTGSNFVEVDSTFTAPNVVILKPEDNSMINIESDKKYEFKYKIDADLSRFKKVVFYLDTNIIFQTQNMEGYFSIQKKITELEKFYKLTMLVLNNSGTGSLADLMGAEGTISTAEWDIRIFQYEPFYPKQPSYQTVNGSLTINWDKYNSPKFSKYQLVKYIQSKSSGRLNGFTMEFNDINQTSYNDDRYFGENAYYEVIVYYRDNNNIYSQKYPLLEKSEEFPKLTVKKNSYSSFDIKWDKSKYYNNIKGYALTTRDISPDIKIQDVDVLNYQYKDLPIGAKCELKFFVLPKRYTDNTNDLDNTFNMPKKTIFTGDSSFQFSDILNGEGSNIYYTESTTNYAYSFKLYKCTSKNFYSDKSISFESSMSSNDYVVSSPAGKYIAFMDGNSISTFADSDFPKFKKFSSTELIGSDLYGGFHTFSISDNGILVASAIPHSNYEVCVYNTITNKKVCSIDIGYNIVIEAKISSNGDYVAFYMSGDNPRTMIYKISGNKAELVTEEFFGYYMVFDPNNNSRLYYYDSEYDRNYYYDCETKTATQFGPDVYTYKAIDFEKGHIVLSKTQNEYEIRDMYNYFNKVYEYKTNFGSGFIKDNIIFFSNGVRCKY